MGESRPGLIPSREINQDRLVVDNIILWFKQAQYDRIFNILNSKLSDGILKYLDEISYHLELCFDEIRQEFVHCIDIFQNVHLCENQNIQSELTECVRDIKKLKSLINTLNKLMVALLLKIETIIDDSSVINVDGINKHYEMIRKSSRSIEFFNRFASFVAVLYDRLVCYNEKLFNQFLQLGLCGESQNIFNTYTNLYESKSKHRRKILHINCLIAKLNKELNSEYNEPMKYNHVSDIYINYPPKCIKDIQQLILIDTVTIDLPKIILMYMLNDLNELFSFELLTDEMINNIIDILKLNKSFYIALKNLWYCDSGDHSYINMFPFLESIVLYDDQRLITLKALIFDNHIDRALNYCNRFSFESMPYEFNSLVVSLYCTSGFYYRILPLIQKSSKQPVYWHIILHFSCEIRTLCSYIVNTFLILDTIDTSFVWKFIDYCIHKKVHHELVKNLSLYNKSQSYINYIQKKINNIATDNQISHQNEFNIGINYDSPSNTETTQSINNTFTLQNYQNDFESDFLDSLNNISTNGDNLSHRSADSLCINETHLPVQSLNGSLGVSMCSSLLSISHDYKSKKIAKRLHYSLNTSFQPIPILKKCSKDGPLSPKNRGSPKKLKFFIDGVVITPGTTRKSVHNLNETFELSPNETFCNTLTATSSNGSGSSREYYYSNKNHDTISEIASDENEYFDALDDFHESIVAERFADAVSTTLHKPLISSPYIDTETASLTFLAPNAVEIFENHSPIEPIKNILNHSPHKFNSNDNTYKKLLDDISTNLNDKFNSLQSFLDNNSTIYTDEVSGTYTMQSHMINNEMTDREEQQLITESRHIVENDEPIETTSFTLPVPSIVKSDSPSTSNITSNDNDADHTTSQLAITIPERRVHRIKHKSVFFNLADGSDLYKSAIDEEDSPYNSYLEKRSFTKSNEVSLIVEEPEKLFQQEGENKLIVIDNRSYDQNNTLENDQSIENERVKLKLENAHEDDSKKILYEGIHSNIKELNEINHMQEKLNSTVPLEISLPLDNINSCNKVIEIETSNLADLNINNKVDIAITSEPNNTVGLLQKALPTLEKSEVKRKRVIGKKSTKISIKRNNKNPSKDVILQSNQEVDTAVVNEQRIARLHANKNVSLTVSKPMNKSRKRFQSDLSNLEVVNDSATSLHTDIKNLSKSPLASLDSQPKRNSRITNKNKIIADRSFSNKNTSKKSVKPLGKKRKQPINSTPKRKTNDLHNIKNDNVIPSESLDIRSHNDETTTNDDSPPLRVLRSRIVRRK